MFRKATSQMGKKQKEEEVEEEGRSWWNCPPTGGFLQSVHSSREDRYSKYATGIYTTDKTCPSCLSISSICLMVHIEEPDKSFSFFFSLSFPSVVPVLPPCIYMYVYTYLLERIYVNKYIDATKVRVSCVLRVSIFYIGPSESVSLSLSVRDSSRSSCS